MVPLRTIIFIAVLPLAASFAGAQTRGRDTKREAAIWSELQATAPEALDVFKQATTAMDAGNFKDAAALYKKAGGHRVFRKSSQTGSLRSNTVLRPLRKDCATLSADPSNCRI